MANESEALFNGESVGMQYALYIHRVNYNVTIDQSDFVPNLNGLKQQTETNVKVYKTNKPDWLNRGLKPLAHGPLSASNLPQAVRFWPYNEMAGAIWVWDPWFRSGSFFLKSENKHYYIGLINLHV